MRTHEARSWVIQGVLLLDENLPGWWREDYDPSINLAVLDLGDLYDCILGQLGGYHRLLRKLGLTLESSVAYGFNVPKRRPTWFNRAWRWPREYHQLTKAWRDVIKTRRLFM